MERISKGDMPEGLMQAMLGVEYYIEKAGLDIILLELIRVRVSQINSCAYCLDMHTKDALHAGETFQRLISLSAWRETSYYTPKERSVLEYAEILTQLEAGLDINEAHHNLLEHFTIQEIANLALAIAQINSWNRIVKSTGIEPGSYQIGI